MTCRSEWDLLAGPMSPPTLTLTLTLTPAYPTSDGRGGPIGDVVGVVAEAVALAGAGLYPTGTPGNSVNES